MKYMISARQESNLRQEADEIYVLYKDRDIIYDLIEQGVKKIVLQIPARTSIDWKEIEMWNQKVPMEAAFQILDNYDLCPIPFYWDYPITTFQELRGLQNMGVCCVKLGAPLYFSLDEIDMPIRLVANKAFEEYMPHDSGIVGTYVRPEDIKYYDEYDITMEFATDTLSQEKALYEIYNSGIWSGNLALLITNLGYNVDNRGLPAEFGKMRTNCGQGCLRYGLCHYCNTAMKFVNMVGKMYEEK